MKAELYTNCSLVRVPVKAGEDKVYLPQNVEWVARKIEKMVICAPDNACIDPIDGVTPVLTATDLAALDGYVTLYDSTDRELMHDVSVENLLARNNHPLRVDAMLNLSLCSISFMTTPLSDATLLMYVFYGTREEEYFDLPKNSISVRFPLAANQEISFREIINYSIHAIPETVKGIIFWNAVNNPAYLTLRDHTLTYQMADLHTELMRPDVNGGSAADSQVDLFLLNELDIDFDYSRIREAAGQSSTQRITFFY